MEYYAIYAVDADEHELKRLAEKIEEGSPIGRLFDIDVVDRDGNGLSREVPRACLVCGEAGRACARSRAHSAEEVYRVTVDLIEREMTRVDAERMANVAKESLVREVNTTPKPGLVDLSNNGSHRDMTPDTFYRSADALFGYFKDSFLIGASSRNAEPEATFSLLRKRGMLAESEMYSATGGVNTHKGAIYSFGIILGAIGRLWRVDKPATDTRDILAEAARLAHGAEKTDFVAADDSTAGMRCYRSYGVRGIRGEAADGFPSVSEIAIPAYRQAVALGGDENFAGLYALISLIAAVEDTALYNRGGREGAEFARSEAKKLLAADALPTLADYERLDAGFISRNLSPGGCADLLAISYFLMSLDNFN